MANLDSDNYEQWLEAISPYWVDKYNEFKRIKGYGATLDTAIERAITSANTGRLTECDPSALDSHGNNRALSRASIDTDNTYRQYLIEAWDLYKLAGTDPGILRALTRLGITNARVVDWQTLMQRGVKVAFDGGYHIIPGANANGGVRYVSIHREFCQVAHLQGPIFNIDIIENTPGGPVSFLISLAIDIAGNIITTAKDIVNEWYRLDILNRYGVGADFTGDGTGLAAGGGIQLTLPLWTYFYIEIDEPNPFLPPNKWDDTIFDQPFKYVPPPNNITENLRAGDTVSPDQAIIAGDNGTILIYSNGKWIQDNTLALGDHLFAVSLHKKASGWICGSSGAVIKYTNGVLSSATPATAETLYGVVSLSDSNAWAVGANGTILHWDGTNWNNETSPVTDDLFCIHAVSSSDIWAAGKDGTIIHLDNGNWVTEASPITEDIYGIHGTGPSKIYAVGEDGKIILWDGLSWANVSSPTTTTLTSIKMFSAYNGIAVGEDASLIRFDGSNWFTANHQVPTNVHFNCVFGALINDIWICGHGGLIIHQVLDSFIPEDTPLVPALNAIWVSANNDVWAGGNNGKLLHYNGNTWSTTETGLVPTQITDVHWFDQGEAILVGTQGKIYRYRSNAQPQLQVEESPTKANLYSVCAISATNAWAVGANGTLLNWNGTKWIEYQSITSKTLYSVYADSANNVWAVGDAGTIIYFDGSMWSIQSSPTANALYDVQGAVGGAAITAVGKGGVIIVWDAINKTWVSQNSGTILDLYSVTVISQTGSAWAVGKSGLIIRRPSFNAAWVNYNAFTANTLNKIRHTYAVGETTARICTVGDGGISYFALHNANGNPPNSFTQINTPTTSNLRCVSLAANTPFLSPTYGLSGGDDGEILLYQSNVNINNWVYFSTAAKAKQIKCFWGSSSANIWAGCEGSVMLYYKNGKWKQVDVPDSGLAMMTSDSIEAIWGFRDSDIWAVGNNGRLLHYDGVVWNKISSPTQNNLKALWGSGPVNVWAAGAAGTLIHYDGTSWSVVNGPSNHTIYSMRGFTSNDIWAVGGNNTGSVIWHYNGNAWSTVTSPTNDPTVIFTCIYGTAPNEMWIISSEGIYKFNGTVFTKMPLKNYTTFTSIGGYAEFMWVVGFDPLAPNNFNGRIMKLFPDRFSNTWDGGGTWDLTEKIPGTLSDIIGAIRKWKLGTSSCRFLRINIQGTWVTVPVGELWETDALGHYITKDYLYDY